MLWLNSPSVNHAGRTPRPLIGKASDWAEGFHKTLPCTRPERIKIKGRKQVGKKSGFTSAEIEEIKRLYLKEGRSILQIPKILGKGSENSVRNALHKARIKNAPEERIKLDRFKPEQIYGEITLLKRLTKSKKLRFHARCTCGYEFDVDPFRLTLPEHHKDRISACQRCSKET